MRDTYTGQVKLPGGTLTTGVRVVIPTTDGLLGKMSVDVPLTDLEAAGWRRLPQRCTYVGESPVETGQQGGMEHQCTSEEGHDGWHVYEPNRAGWWMQLEVMLRGPQ